MKSGIVLNAGLVVWAAVAGTSSSPAHAASNKARLTGLSDVAFGLIASNVDQSASQSVCAYSSSNTNGYSVTAIGSGGGGAFELLAGATPLPYDVLWSDAGNQTSGVALAPGTTRSGFTSTASQQTCNSGPSSSASLTVIIRSATLMSARAGTYSGMLQITIAPE
uniref:hypothetical protein n=1 Tax=Altererythrobacter segetis TaxID=1104773 RepID=UPI00140D0251|nr:hypothetical protein [Altererythrobacter segetis]